MRRPLPPSPRSSAISKRYTFNQRVTEHRPTVSRDAQWTMARAKRPGRRVARPSVLCLDLRIHDRLTALPICDSDEIDPD